MTYGKSISHETLPKSAFREKPYPDITVQQAGGEAGNDQLIDRQTEPEDQRRYDRPYEPEQDDWFPAIRVGSSAPRQPREEGAEREDAAYDPSVLPYLLLIVRDLEIPDEIVEVREDRGEGDRFRQPTACKDEQLALGQARHLDGAYKPLLPTSRHSLNSKFCDPSTEGRGQDDVQSKQIDDTGKSGDSEAERRRAG